MGPEAKFNLHRVVGMVAIITMIVAIIAKGWDDMPWPYLAFAFAVYAGALVASFILRIEDFRLIMGCHVALIFLAIGIMLDLGSPGAHAGFFIASISSGIAIPFILLKQ